MSETGDLNNPPADPAVGSEEEGHPILDELYDTLADVERGIDLRQSEAREQQQRVLEAEQDLLQQRQEAEEADDTDRYTELTEQLEDLRRAWHVLNDEELGTGEQKPESDDGRALPGSPHGGGREDADEPGD